MSNEPNRWVEKEIERLFDGKPTITKEQLRQAIDENAKRRGHRGHGGPVKEEMKQKFTDLLTSEINKIDSNAITKEQAKSFLSSFGDQAKEQWHTHMDEQLQSTIKNELTKLNTNEIDANKARDLLRNIGKTMRPPQRHGGSPAILNDDMKTEFLNQFKSIPGADKVNTEEVWKLMKAFDKQQHDKMGCCEREVEWEKDKDKRWEEAYDAAFKKVVGDSSKKLDQQQIERLAKAIKEEFRSDFPRHPGKRFCNH